MSLRRTLRSGVAAACILGVAAPAGYAAPTAPKAQSAALQVRIAQAKDFSRLEFHWAGGARVSARREGDKVVLRFSRDAKPNLAQLRASPPRFLKTAESRSVGGVLEIVLTLDEGADFKVGQDERGPFVNLFEKAEGPPPAETEPPPPEAPHPDPGRANPVPASGVVTVGVKSSAQQLSMRFDWAAPAGAAVFRRGEAVWIVFDGQARLDIGKLPRAAGQFRDAKALSGPGWSALRLVVPKTTAVAAVGEGSSWTVTLGAGAPAGRYSEGGGTIEVRRDAESADAALSVAMAGAGRPVWIDDPAVGDRIAVVPALAPSKGLTGRRAFVDLSLLPTVQGLAIEPYATGLGVSVDGDLVRIGKGSGLALSPAWAGQQAAPHPVDELGAPVAAAMPGLIGETWSKTGHGGFMGRYDQLLAAAATESDGGDAAPTEARLALARFLIGSELSYEAIGVLNAAARKRETLMGEAEFRGLRGVARAMAGRLKEAEADLSVPILAEDPASAAWRAYIAGRLGNWAEARAGFAKASQAMDMFPPIWRARFERADAEAALALGDAGAAHSAIRRAGVAGIPPAEEMANRLVEARVIEAQGDKDKALAIYDAIAKAPLDQYAAPALLRATQIKLEQGKIAPPEAVATFDALRYRWRGDATELETIRLLGKLYLDQGRYREALEVLRSAGTRLPDLPQAVELQNDLSTAFRSLFLDGLADGLEPIQALGLFEDFQELTPIGADGDLMVRKMVRRLVDVDLLTQAAELLKYQVENRLDGAPQAQVATDLALIYLMDRKPEQALLAINNSRTTLLSPALNADRRILTARALMGLGRLDAALEILENDTGPEAADVRSEIAWKARNWPLAGDLFERSLGERWKQSVLPLRPDEEGRLLRAGVAYSLAGDDVSLTRMRDRFSPLFDAARNPDALRVAFAAMDGGQLAPADFGRTVADAEAFNGWVAKMKQKFRDKPAPVGLPTMVAEAKAKAEAAAAPKPAAPKAAPPKAADKGAAH